MHTKKWVRYSVIVYLPYKNIPTQIIHVENIYFTIAVFGPPYDVGYSRRKIIFANISVAKKSRHKSCTNENKSELEFLNNTWGLGTEKE